MDVNGRVVEVHDELREGRYHRVRSFTGDAMLAPAAFADARLRVSDLFAE